jgi:hypothetical protein
VPQSASAARLDRQLAFRALDASIGSWRAFNSLRFRLGSAHFGHLLASSPWAFKALCPRKLRGQCGINKMGGLTELIFAAIQRAAMTQEQPILIIFCGIIPG